MPRCCPSCYLYDECEKRGECCEECDFYSRGKCMLMDKESYGILDK